MKDLLLVIVGGVLAVIGGFAGVWFQTIFASKRRFKEIIAEKMVEIYPEAIAKIFDLRCHIPQSSDSETLQFIEDNLDWLKQNRAFLPQRIYDNWHEIRRISRQIVWHRNGELHLSLEEIKGLEKSRENLTDESEKLLLKNFDLKPFRGFKHS